MSILSPSSPASSTSSAPAVTGEAPPVREAPLAGREALNSRGGSPLVREAEHLSAALQRARAAVSRVIIGQEEIIEQTLITLLCGGHALLVGLPGLGKTSLVHAVSRALEMPAGRIQFTPDLLPGDILGSEILEENGAERGFRFVHGPIFCSLLMADEINRASPRTQSALLQGMQEKHVTIAGRRYDLPKPFHVLATQNPIEQEGTYPLPEAQLDRFLMHIEMRYPEAAKERRILIETTGDTPPQVEAALRLDELEQAQRLVRRMPVGERLVDMILRLIRSARPSGEEGEETILWGPSSRGGQALMLACRARALLDGRLAPSAEDVHALAVPILRHRMALRFEALAKGVKVEALIQERCAAADAA